MNQLEPLPNGTSARLWRRLAAIAYDLLIVAALLMTATIVVILLRGGDAIPAGSVWFQTLLLGIWWLYFAWSWAERGQSVGMRAWRLMLAPDDGVRLGWTRASLRFLAAGLSTAVLGLGFVWCLVDRDGLAWHDRLSRTALRGDWRSAQPRDREHRYRQ